MTRHTWFSSTVADGTVHMAAIAQRRTPPGSTCSAPVAPGQAADPGSIKRSRMIVMKRAYESAEASDGYRVLVERLWPRGVKKENARLDAWEKGIAPSDALRKWYEHDPAKWIEFQQRYERELTNPAAQQTLDSLAKRGKRGRVTLVYSSRDGEISAAAVLVRLLRARVPRRG